MFWSEPFGTGVVFRNPDAFRFLILIPIFLTVSVFWFLARKKAFQDGWLKMHIKGSFVPGVFGIILHTAAVCLALVFITAALAKPERKLVSNEPEYGGIRMAFLLDTSLSMKRAEDLKPNRLAAAKKVIADFVLSTLLDPEMKGRYKFALIPFAGGAYPFFAPFTASQDEFLAILEEVDEKTVNIPGTSLYSALKAYEELLFMYGDQNPDTLEMAMLISDGGKEEQSAEELGLVLKTASFLRDGFHGNIIINTVGIGKVVVNEYGERSSEAVELIIRDDAGNFVDFYREESDKPPYLSRLDEEILVKVAGIGGGQYYHFSEEKETLANFKKTVLKHRKFKGNVPINRYESVRAWFLFPALALIYVLFGYGKWMSRIVHAFRFKFC